MTEDRRAELRRYENELKEAGFRYVAGVDEAGRGPLAGPVCAACVIFDLYKEFPDADDSKKLTPAKRDALFDQIISMSEGYGIAFSDNKRIDEINILQATYEAMREAVLSAVKMSGINPDRILIDHVHIPKIPFTQISITHGDALSVTIGSASILAKVSRDRLMEEYAVKYPGYGFEKHKGYGTKDHYEAIRKIGISEIHRKTFLKTIH